MTWGRSNYGGQIKRSYDVVLIRACEQCDFTVREWNGTFRAIPYGYSQRIINARLIKRARQTLYREGIAITAGVTKEYLTPIDGTRRKY